MNLKLIVAILVIAAMPAYAQPKKPSATPKKPSTTNVTTDAQKVVKIISSDKARTQAYCDIGKLGGQIGEAEQKKDMNKIDELNKKMDELATKTGSRVCRDASGHRPQFKTGSRDRFGARSTRQVVCKVTAGVPRQMDVRYWG